MGVEELQAKIDSCQRKIDDCLGKDDDDGAERYGIELQRLERKLVKEEAKLPVHPAYVLFFFLLFPFSSPCPLPSTPAGQLMCGLR